MIRNISKISDCCTLTEGAQQFEILTNHSNKEINFVVLMCLRKAQTHKNNNEFFSYYELLEDAFSPGEFGRIKSGYQG